jgi:hypothetical protein
MSRALLGKVNRDLGPLTRRTLDVEAGQVRRRVDTVAALRMGTAMGPHSPLYYLYPYLPQLGRVRLYDMASMVF